MEPGTENEFLMAATDLDSFEDGGIVGEYKQTTLNRKRVIHQLDTIVPRKT